MAQYLGQRYYTTNIAPYNFTIVDDPIELDEITIRQSVVYNGSLLLRTVDMLADEEKEIFNDTWDLQQFILDFNGLYVNEEYWHPSASWEMCQYLLRIGILLPFTYLNDQNQPETLTPAKLIEAGWAKIKAS